jgi:hypothetical protein
MIVFDPPLATLIESPTSSLWLLCDKNEALLLPPLHSESEFTLRARSMAVDGMRARFRILPPIAHSQKKSQISGRMGRAEKRDARKREKEREREKAAEGKKVE